MRWAESASYPQLRTQLERQFKSCYDLADAMASVAAKRAFIALMYILCVYRVSSRACFQHGQYGLRKLSVLTNLKGRGSQGAQHSMYHTPRTHATRNAIHTIQFYKSQFKSVVPACLQLASFQAKASAAVTVKPLSQ